MVSSVETEGSDHAPNNGANRRESASPPSKRSAADYPRRRVAIACAVCRTRRSKCDAKKPSCSRCLEIGIECEYRQPGLWDRTSASVTQSSLEKFDLRLSRIEEAVERLASSVSDFVTSRNVCLTTSNNDLSSSFEPCFPPVQSPPFWTPSPVVPGSQICNTGGHRMPNLITFSPPPSLEPFAYDDSSTFFAGELNRGDKLFNHLDNAPIYVDLSPRTCWRLQRSFIRNFLRWVPIFDDQTCFKHIQIATSCGHHGKSPDVCLTLLMYAIGAIAEDESFYQGDSENLSGYSYILLALKSLDELHFPTGDITHLQCKVLMAAYMSFAMRPVQAWNAINQVSRDLMLFLKTEWRAQENPKLIGLVERIFWVTYVMENELEICLELQTNGVHSINDELALPLSLYEEEGMFYFLAMASHRKLLVEVMNTIGFKSGAAHYLPIMATELRKQLDDWYNHLPAPVKFPRDTSSLFDLRRAHLRGQYFAIIIIMNWPFVLHYLQSALTSTTDGQFDLSDKPQVCERVKEYFEFCCIFIKSTEEILMQKTFCAHLNLRGTYAFTMILIFSHTPIFKSLELPDYTDIVTRSIKTLTAWHEVPFMKEPLNRIRRFALETGMIVEV